MPKPIFFGGEVIGLFANLANLGDYKFNVNRLSLEVTDLLDNQTRLSDLRFLIFIKAHGLDRINYQARCIYDFRGVQGRDEFLDAQTRLSNITAFETRPQKR